MVVVKVDLPNELDLKFKKKVLDTYGYKKGSISQAMIEAIKMWIEHENLDLHDYINYDEIRAQYTGKYIVLKDNEIELVKDTLEEIYDELPSLGDEKFQLLTPRKNKFNQVRGRRLGWRMKRLQ